jgi:DNA-binding CsgD family transcriptional regulator
LGRQALTSEGRLLAGAAAVFAAVAVLAAVDLAFDLRQGTTARHLLAEGAAVVLAIAGAVGMARHLAWLTREARASREEARALAERLKATEAEAARWRAEARDLLQGLGAALGRQFERWGLSPAEEEVALLLLKGLSHKEIAEVRSIAEATARQQARAVYRKAGLSGRNDLAAFFLEDLLLPGGDAKPD